MQKKKIEKKYGQFLTFDDTPFYVYNSTVVKRIKTNFPNAKIIVILRNPIDRAYSNYFLGVNGGKEKREFEEAIEYAQKELKGQEQDSYWFKYWSGLIERLNNIKD